MHRVPSQANQLPTATPHMILDQPQPRVGASCSKRSFPTNNAHQVAHNSPKGDNPTHAHRGEAPPINQSTNQPTNQPTSGNPCGSVRRKQRVPPQATPYSTTPTANRDPQDTSLNQHQQQPPRRALARKYSTKDQTDSQPSTTINQVHAHVVLGGGHSD